METAGQMTVSSTESCKGKRWEGHSGYISTIHDIWTLFTLPIQTFETSGKNDHHLNG